MCMLVESLGLLNHLLGDVYANTKCKMSRKSLRQPANTAPEIQCCATVIGKAVNSSQVARDRLNFLIPGRHELRRIPFAAHLAVIGQDGPQRIALSEIFQ